MSRYYHGNKPIVYISGKPYIKEYEYPGGTMGKKVYHIPVYDGIHYDQNAYNRYINNTTHIERSQSVPKPKKKIDLILNIETVKDLIDLGMKYGKEYPKDVIYNINLEMIANLIEPLKELDNMIGQIGLKKQIVELILYYSQDLNIKNDDLLHTIIDGEPGTGKTQFAHIISKIYLKMGVLKNDIFKKVKRSDLIAGFLGQTALKTQSVIEEVRGGVLFIDEAYSLGNSEGKDSKDVYSKECIDILNQNLTEMRDEDDDYFICMIAGYKDDLKNSFFSYNDGLERRFPIHFTMDKYTDQDLVDIFKRKVEQNKWELEDDAIDQALINKNRDYFKFSGGDMEVLFAKCKISHSKNIISTIGREKRKLNKKDVEMGIEIFKKNRLDNDKKEDNTKWQSLYN
jgi:Holliday junction resolvasome RuvABC ATP-dependent DNA helicase subunit